MARADDQYDLIVIGGGSAGLVAAGGAAILGARVALVEKNLLGGDCLYTGCVPSKTLIKSAKFAAQLKRAADFGFEISNFNFQDNSFASVTNRVRNVIEIIERHDAPEVFEKMGVRLFFGAAQFLNPNEIEVALRNSNEKVKLKAQRFCLATGSRPLIPPIEGLKEAGFITNEEIFRLKELPKSLIVVGGGAIGLELGQAFRRLGSRVRIVEAAERILMKEDEEVSALITRILKKESVEILTGAKIVRVKKSEIGTKILVVEKDGDELEIDADEILIAAGRQPNTNNLELEKAGVKFDAKGILTDEYLQTSAKKIFAAGDVAGHFQFTHTADYEARIVVQNAFVPFPFKKKLDFSAVPWATFTEPEIARVGLTEREAREKFGDEKIKIYKVVFEDNDRAQAESETEGFAKIILHRNKIIGAHIVGAHAGEIIHEFVLAMTHNLSLDDLNHAIHIYPTLAKITQAAATEKTLETLKSPFVQKWFGRYLKIWRR